MCLGLEATVDGHNTATHDRIFVLGAFFENVFIPKGWQHKHKMVPIPTCLDLTDYTMVSIISICKFDAHITPYALIDIP